MSIRMVQICKYKLLPFSQTTSQLIKPDNQSKNTRCYLSEAYLSNPHDSQYCQKHQQKRLEPGNLISTPTYPRRP
jgi:hypothetical protein